MSDTETGTEWSHLLGRAMAGPLKGRVLKPLVSDMLTWSAWKTRFPETTVLSMSRTRKNYSREFYRNPTRFVFGFEVNGRPFAVPMNQLVRQPVGNVVVDQRRLLVTFERSSTACRLFEANVDGQPLSFTQEDQETMRDDQTSSLWRISTAECIEGPMQGAKLKPRVGIMSYRVAWKNFHPESTDVAFYASPSPSGESAPSDSGP